MHRSLHLPLTTFVPASTHPQAARAAPSKPPNALADACLSRRLYFFGRSASSPSWARVTASPWCSPTKVRSRQPITLQMQHQSMRRGHPTLTRPHSEPQPLPPAASRRQGRLREGAHRRAQGHGPHICPQVHKKGRKSVVPILPGSPRCRDSLLTLCHSRTVGERPQYHPRAPHAGAPQPPLPLQSPLQLPGHRVSVCNTIGDKRG